MEKSRDQSGVDLFDGQPYESCVASLRVVEVMTTTTFPLEDGCFADTTPYECAGPRRHWFGFWIDLQLKAPSG